MQFKKMFIFLTRYQLIPERIGKVHLHFHRINILNIRINVEGRVG